MYFSCIASDSNSFQFNFSSIFVHPQIDVNWGDSSIISNTNSSFSHRHFGQLARTAYFATQKPFLFPFRSHSSCSSYVSKQFILYWDMTSTTTTSTNHEYTYVSIFLTNQKIKFIRCSSTRTHRCVLDHICFVSQTEYDCISVYWNLNKYLSVVLHELCRYEKKMKL